MTYPNHMKAVVRAVVVFVSGLGLTAQPTSAAPPRPTDDPAVILVRSLERALGKANVIAGKLAVEQSASGTRVTGTVRMWASESRVTASFDAGNALDRVEASFRRARIDLAALQSVCGGKLAAALPGGLSPNAGFELHRLAADFAGDGLSGVEVELGTAQRWTVLDAGPFSASDLRVTFDVRDPRDADKRRTLCTVSAAVDVGSGNKVPCRVRGSIDSSDKTSLELRATLNTPLVLSAVVRAVGGDRAAKVLATLPAALAGLRLTGEVVVWTKPYRKTAGLEAETPLGRIQLVAAKDTDAKNTDRRTRLVAVLAPPPGGRKLGDINKALAAVDKLLNLSQQTLVFATDRFSGGTELNVAGIAEHALGPGLNLVAELDPKRLKIDRVLGTSEKLRVRAEIPFPDPLGMVLHLDTSPNLALGKGAKLDSVGVTIRPNPTNFEVALVGALDVTVDRQRLPLAMRAGFDVTSQTLQLEASTRQGMQAEWRDPLGLRGAALSDLAVAAGVTFGTGVPLPVLGFAGALRIGEGKKAVRGNAAFLLNPREPNNSMLAFQLDRLQLGELVQLAAPRSYAQLSKTSLAKSLFASQVQNLNVRIAPAAVTLGDLRFEQGFLLAGDVRLLGMAGRGRIDISEARGLKARVEVDPVRLAGGAVQLRGFAGRKKPVLDLTLSPAVQSLLVNGEILLANGFFTGATDFHTGPGFVRFNARGKIHGAIAGSLRASASTSPDRLASSSLQIEATIDSSLADIQKRAERLLQNKLAADVAKIQAAQRDVSRWRAVNWDLREKQTRDLIVARREKQLEAVRAAAQRERDAAANSWRATGKSIDSAKSQIKTKSKQRKAALKRAQFKRAAKLQAQITDLTAKIAKLEVQRRSRKAKLDAINVGKSVTAARNKMIPIATEPEMVALLSEKKSREAAGTAAIAVLQGYKLAVSGTKQAAYWVSQNARRALTLEHAQFATALSAATGGFVQLAFEGVFLDKRFKTRFRANITSPERLAAGIVHLMLGGAPADRSKRLSFPAQSFAFKPLPPPKGAPSRSTSQVLAANQRGTKSR